MSAMSELDIEVQERVRKTIDTNHRNALRRFEAVSRAGRPGAFLLARESDFWLQLLVVFDGVDAPTRNEAMVLAYTRTPIERRVLVRAHQAAKQARLDAAKNRPAMEVVA